MGETGIIAYEQEEIKNLIYTIRGKQVMLDIIENTYHMYLLNKE